MPPDLPRAALAYASHGWAVFPLRPGEKTPACAHGCKDATTERERVAAWWRECPEYGVGVATGSVSGICVVDLDGDPRALMAALLRRGPLPATMTSRTGSGGAHLIYRLGGARVPNSARRLAPGVDTRGEGGYIVAPPSRHPCGAHYAFANRLPTATVPRWIVKALTEAPIRPPSKPAGGHDPEGPVEFLRRTVNGKRNDVLYWAARRLFKEAPADIDRLAGELHTAALEAGLAELEVQKTIRSAHKATLEGR